MNDEMTRLGELLMDIMISNPEFEQRLENIMQQAVLEALQNNPLVRDEVRVIAGDVVDEPYTSRKFRDIVRGIVRDMDFTVSVEVD